jgi:hypothetical protein
MRGGQATLQLCVVKVEFLAASTLARRRRRSCNGRPEDEVFSSPAHLSAWPVAICQAEGVLSVSARLRCITGAAARG